ncbi:MAG: hypothetical protein QXU87_03925, partial [Candidatus Caldarchaeum sp.]
SSGLSVVNERPDRAHPIPTRSPPNGEILLAPYLLSNRPLTGIPTAKNRRKTEKGMLDSKLVQPTNNSRGFLKTLQL